MKTSKASILLHPLFIFSLVLLLANDFYWKQQYHNWLTGKLSDFAGMIVLPVFLLVVFPTLSKTRLFLFCLAFFLWWKSPLSQSFIDLLNDVLPVERVVDYSDWLALFFLPLGMQLKAKTLPVHSMAAYGVRWALGAIAFMSLCATSMPYRSLFLAHPDDRDIYLEEAITKKTLATAVLENLKAKGLVYRMDSVMYYPVLNQQSLYRRLPTGSDSMESWQQVSQDTTLYLKREGAPYFIIPFYQSSGHVFRNIRFSMFENRYRNKTKIMVESFQAEGVRNYDLTDKKKRKEYKEVFEKLFSE